MTERNTSNYIGVNSDIVAYAAADARIPAYDKEGTRGVLEVALPVNEGYKKDGEFIKTSVTWYTYSGAGEFATNVLSKVKKGDKIRVANAKQEVREYTCKDGVAKLGITLRFGDFQVLESATASEDENPF